jgi:hypothetical protein
VFICVKNFETGQNDFALLIALEGGRKNWLHVSDH